MALTFDGLSASPSRVFLTVDLLGTFPNAPGLRFEGSSIAICDCEIQTKSRRSRAIAGRSRRAFGQP